MVGIIKKIQGFFLGETDTYKDKIFKHRLRTFYRAILLLALVGLVIFAVKIKLDNRVYTESEVQSEAILKVAENSSYKAYGKNLLIYSKDGISAYDSAGAQLWNQSYQMQNPIVDTKGNYVVVGDYKGSVIYVMNLSGLVGENDTDMLIHDLNVSSQGVVTAILEDGNSIMVNHYTGDGKTLIADIKTSMNKSGYPIAASLSDDHIKLGVSYLKANGGKINSSVAFYNFGDVGQNQTHRLASGFDYDEIVIPYIKYVDSNCAVAIADSRLLIYSGSQIPEEAVNIELEEKVHSVFCNKDMIALVFMNPSSEEKYLIHIYNMKGKQLTAIKTNIEYEEILLENNEIIIYNESRLQIYNKKGDAKYDGTIGENIEILIPTENKNKFLIGQKDKIKMIRLR